MICDEKLTLGLHQLSSFPWGCGAFLFLNSLLIVGRHCLSKTIFCFLKNPAQNCLAAIEPESGNRMKKSSYLDKLIHLTSIHSKLRSAIFSMRPKNSGPYFTVRTSNSVNKKYLNDECVANCQVRESCYCKFRCVFLDRERGRVKQYPFILGLPSRRTQQLK